MKDKLVHWFIIGTFVGLYTLVSLISTIHVIEFFELSNVRWLAITLAIAFEVGAAASLASLVTLEKMNKTLVFLLFITLTLFQSMGNSYYAFVHLHDFQGWIELFGLQDEELIFQKRILAIISGGILPLIALGFIKSLVDYIKPKENQDIVMSVPEGKEFNTPYPIPDGDEYFDEIPEEKISKLKEEIIPETEVKAEPEDKYTKDSNLDEESQNDIETFGKVLKRDEVNPIDKELQIKQPPSSGKNYTAS